MSDVLVIQEDNTVVITETGVDVIEIENNDTVEVTTGDIVIGNSGTGDIIDIETGEDINSKVAVMLRGGKVYRFDSTDITQHNLFLGITLQAGLAGTFIRVQRSGVVNEPSWSWTQDATIYMSGNVLSETAPTTGLYQIVGAAQSPTSILLHVQDSIQQ